ncbi:MAG: hypothetical protein AB7G28_22140 [Pirellulales bacterium]
MARQGSDREDLLRDATALVERIELAPLVGSDAEHIIAGFRANGAMSIYFGADPAYHFNSAGELRRAYLGGLLYKAEHGQLVSLERVGAANQVQLLSRPLGEAAQLTTLATMHGRLGNLAEQIASGGLNVVGQVPQDADVLGRVAAWFREHGNIRVAEQPHAR